MKKYIPEKTQRRSQANAHQEFTPGEKTEGGPFVENGHQVQFPSSVAPPALQLKVSPIQAMGISYRQLPEKSTDLQEIQLEPGAKYTITADDMDQGDEESIWRHIARNHGMLPEKLQLFNDRILTIKFAGITHYGPRNTPALKEGGTLYIPSADELSFLAFREQFPTYDEAVQEYGKFIGSKNQKILRKGYKRASGEIGKSYGTEEREFYSPNKGLAGVSRRNSANIDGQREYRINWELQSGEGYWKCNIFMHDVVYDAGYVPHLGTNKHYPTAGKLHKSRHFTKLKVSEVKPGTLVQLYGGTGQDASHNMVLTSFVKRIPKKDGMMEQWSFSAIGAEYDRSAESVRQHEVDPDESGDFYKVTAGTRQFIRFFEPKEAR